MSIADDILAVTRHVTKEWTKQRKAEEKGARSRHARGYVYSDRVYFTEVAGRILPPAYQFASGGGIYTVSKRHLYYACREEFKRETFRELEYEYFAQTLLVQYMNRHRETSAWKVTADPRGTLTIPNAGHAVRVPVGTIQIDNHLRGEQVKPDPYADAEGAEVQVEWPSLAAGQRYQGVLYIEKEGFGPLLEEAEIAERFDLAIVSCKGQSTVAARRFVDEVCAAGRGVPLFVVHDFDKAGFEISQRLTTVSDWAEDHDRVAYRFRNEIAVTDLGLRLADVESCQLLGKEERVRFEGGFARDSIATKEEREFLRSGRRVELNALSAPQFVGWLEAKLAEHLPGRLIPADDILEAAYRRALAIARLNEAIEDARHEAVETAKAATVPESLRRKLVELMKGRNARSWDTALYDLVAGEVGPLDEDEEVAGD